MASKIAFMFEWLIEVVELQSFFLREGLSEFKRRHIPQNEYHWRVERVVNE